MESSLGKVAKKLIFCSFVPPLPLAPDLSDPGKVTGSTAPKLNLSNTTNLYINSPKESTDNSRVGAWYLLPEKSSGRVEPLTEKDTLILYLHGNSHNRSQEHRVELYKVLVTMGYHVLAIDYRGFGDSSAVDLTEKSVVEDARVALNWVADKLGDQLKVVVWGHSLGSAIAIRMVAEFDMETGGSSTVAALILEAPFNNMVEQINSFWMLSPLLQLIRLEPVLRQHDVLFQSDKWLPAVRCPVLILHAEDDRVIMHELGQKLTDNAQKAGKNNIRMVKFERGEGLGHCGIHRSEKLPETISSFLHNQ